MKVLQIAYNLPNSFDNNTGIWMVPYLQRMAEQTELSCLYFQSLTRYLRPDKFFAFLKNYNFIKPSVEEEKIDLIPLKYWGAPGYLFYTSYTHKKIIKSLEKVMPVLRSKSFDIIHAHFSYPSAYVAKIISENLKVPFLVTEHAGNFNFLLNHSKKVEDIYSEAAAYIYVSEEQKKKINRLMGKSAKREFTLPMGVDEKKFKPLKDNTLKDPVRLLYVGWLVKEKGLFELLEAVKILEKKGYQLSLTIVGKGKAKQQFVGETKDIRGKVVFTGEIQNQDLPAFYQDCDIYVLPSHAESFGISLGEALSSGKPCVATKCGGPEKVIKNINGILVDGKNSESLAVGIESVINNYELYNNALLISESFTDNYSVGKIIKKTLNIYKEILAQ